MLVSNSDLNVQLTNDLDNKNKKKCQYGPYDICGFVTFGLFVFALLGYMGYTVRQKNMSQ